MKLARYALVPVATLLALGACADAEPQVTEEPDPDTVLDMTSDTPESVENYSPEPEETGEGAMDDTDAMSEDMQ